LIAAIAEANTNGKNTNMILLEAGIYTLTAIDNITEGANGLPLITSTLTIQGKGQSTVIERADGSPAFRLFHVAATGTLRLRRLTLRRGVVVTFGPLNGAGLFNSGGTVVLSDTIFDDNFAGGGGGGLYNTKAGTVVLSDTLGLVRHVYGFLVYTHRVRVG
jgi:hypothetical protein